MSCTDKDKYKSKDGICCDRCPAGQHMKTECNRTQATECAACGRGFFTATRNHLPKCHVCMKCSPNNNKRTQTDCTGTQDTVCECVTGLFCINDDCDHCQPVTRCPPGEGVQRAATRTNDTVCVTCVDGTFSNVTDFFSPCKAHTRCEDYGRLMKTQGNRTTDSVCGNFKSYCSWMLPAGLWSGLVLTIILLLAFILWRAKHKAYKTDGNLLSCAIHDRLKNIPAKSDSASSDGYKHHETREGFGQMLRSHSEPQEDEWCGISQ